LEMNFDIKEKEKKESVSNFWERMRQKSPGSSQGKPISFYRGGKFLETGTRYESEGKKKESRLNPLFSFLKRKKEGKSPESPSFSQAKSQAQPKKETLKNSLSKEEIENFLGKGYENRSGSQEVIRVEKLFKNFVLGDTVVEVLKDINFSVDQGEFVMLVGPSGCGKSTLLHSIYGLEDPTEGKIWIDGLDIWSESKNWRADFRNKNVGFIPQQSFWIKSFSVLENIAIPAAINGESFSSALEKAAKLIQLVGMEHRAENRPYDLSGGEQQKIAMARALLMNPKFIIADEPTGNLDQKSGEELMNLFREFNKRFNITILMVTHNPGQYKYCTKLIEMVDGRIISQKKTRE